MVEKKGLKKKNEKMEGIKEVKETRVQAEENIKGKMGEAKEGAMKKKEEMGSKMEKIQEGAVGKKEGVQEGVKTRRTQAEDIWSDIMRSFRGRQEDFGRALSEYTSSQKPLTDVIETDDDVIIKVDLPGVKKEDINIGIAEDSVEVMAKFEEKSEVRDVNYIQKERTYGETLRKVSLPAKVKTEETTGTFSDSILTIKMPKLEKKMHKLDIQ